MANIPILNLPVAISLTGTEWIPAVQNGTTVRIESSFFGGGGSGPAPLNYSVQYANNGVFGGSLGYFLPETSQFIYDFVNGSNGTPIPYIPSQAPSSSMAISVFGGDIGAPVTALTLVDLTNGIDGVSLNFAIDSGTSFTSQYSFNLLSDGTFSLEDLSNSTSLIQFNPISGGGTSFFGRPTYLLDLQGSQLLFNGSPFGVPVGNAYQLQMNNEFSGWAGSAIYNPITDLSYYSSYVTQNPVYPTRNWPWGYPYYFSIYEIVDPYYAISSSITVGYFYTNGTGAGADNDGQLVFTYGAYNTYEGEWLYAIQEPYAGSLYPAQLSIGCADGSTAFSFWTCATGATQSQNGTPINFIRSATVNNDGGWYLGTATGGSKGVGTINAQGLYANGVPVATGVLTVDTLPAAAAGARSFVSDSTVVATGNFGATVVGSGLYTVPVWSDGSAWYIG